MTQTRWDFHTFFFSFLDNGDYQQWMDPTNIERRREDLRYLLREAPSFPWDGTVEAQWRYLTDHGIGGLDERLLFHWAHFAWEGNEL